jgi:hypothetical protein
VTYCVGEAWEDVGDAGWLLVVARRGLFRRAVGGLLLYRSSLIVAVRKFFGGVSISGVVVADVGI